VRRAALLALLACGGAPPTTPPSPVAVTISPDAGALPPSDAGEDRCHAIDPGEAEILAGDWLVSRDLDHRCRVRKIEPRNVEFRAHRATMAIGDRAQLAGMTIEWRGVTRVSKTNEPVIELTIRHPSWVEPKREALSLANPTRQLHVPKSHDVVSLNLETVNDDATAIAIVETTSDESAKAGFGDSLKDGEYVFPDGLRVRYRYNRDCEYDPSTPCYWHHEITATKGEVEKYLELDAKNPSRSALGHTFRIVDEKLVVR
jgi:hypothetical protein